MHSGWSDTADDLDDMECYSGRIAKVDLIKGVRMLIIVWVGRPWPRHRLRDPHCTERTLRIKAAIEVKVIGARTPMFQDTPGSSISFEVFNNRS